MRLATDGPEGIQWIIEIVDELGQQRRFGAAISILNKGRLLHPENAELASLHGEVLLTIGKASQAVRILQHAQELKPSDPKIIEMLGIALQRTGNMGAAVSLLRKGHRNHPHDLPIAATLGRTLSKAGRFEEAIGLMKYVLAQFPESARVASTLGTILLDARDYAAFDELMGEVPQKIARSPRILHVQAYSKFLRYEKEAARRILEPVALKQKGVTAITILYIASAENGDETLRQMKVQLGRNAFERASLRAHELHADEALRTAVSRRYATPTSPVLRGTHPSPVNRGAINEMLNREYGNN